MQEATKCLTQRMDDPSEYDMGELRRVARHLKKVALLGLRSLMLDATASQMGLEVRTGRSAKQQGTLC